jgi:hypothetical protein
MLRFIVLAICVAAAITNSARSQPVDLSQTDPAQLVRQLADPMFRKRELAEAELQRRGPEAISAVKRGCEDDDIEVRRRCQAILGKLLTSEADRFLEPFLAGKDDPRMLLPGWEALKLAAGSDDTSRTLYALLYKSDRALLQMLERNPKSAAEQFDLRLTRITKKFAADADSEREKDVSGEEMASLLLIAAARRTGLEPPDTRRLLTLLEQPAVRRSIEWSRASKRLVEKCLEKRCAEAEFRVKSFEVAHAYGCGDPIRARIRAAVESQIAAAAANLDDLPAAITAIAEAKHWKCDAALEKSLIPAAVDSLRSIKDQPPDPKTVANWIRLTKDLKLKDGVGLAQAAMSDPKLARNTRHEAIATVALLGDRQSIAALEQLLDDDTLVNQWTSAGGVRTECQIRDIALSALIHLTGQKLADFNLAPNRETIDRPDTLPLIGFPSDDQRDEAQNAWRRSRKGKK